MAKTDDRHFSADPEILEEYVLDRLDPSMRRHVEDHLRTCKQCRRAVDEERLLAAGVRRFGRNELRRRLAGRRESAVGRRVRWHQVLAAAAVLVALAGVSVYEKWFTGTELDRVQPPRELSLRVEPGSHRDEDRAKTRVQEDKAMTLREAPRPSPGPSGTVPASRSESATGRKEEILLGKQEQTAPLALSMNDDNRVKSKDAQYAYHASTVDREEAGAPVWAEGVILPLHTTAQPSDERTSGFAQKKIAAAGKEREGQPPAAEEKPTGSRFAVSQQLSSALPPSRQVMQRNLQAGTIQTLIDQRADSVHMTLFLDSLIDHRDLENVTVRIVTPDSLIVNIANRRVGYRLPAGWQMHSPALRK
jgi:hypothetical protein